MKKFSNLITESSKGLWRKGIKMHPLMNPVDWEEIFEPLINHINENLKSKQHVPGSGIFTSNTEEYLAEFIERVNRDYKEYYQYEIFDGTPDSFLSAWKIDANYEDIIDCIQPLLDNANEFITNENWSIGEFIISIQSIRHKNIQELEEDILDIHGKLKMLDINFEINIETDKPIYAHSTDNKIQIKKNNEDIKGLILSPSKWRYTADVKNINQIYICISKKD